MCMQEAKMQILGGHTEVTAVVNQPVVNVSVTKAKKGSLISTAGARAGMDIVVSKWVGIEGNDDALPRKRKPS